MHDYLLHISQVSFHLLSHCHQLLAPDVLLYTSLQPLLLTSLLSNLSPTFTVIFVKCKLLPTIYNFKACNGLQWSLSSSLKPLRKFKTWHYPACSSAAASSLRLHSSSAHLLHNVLSPPQTQQALSYLISGLLSLLHLECWKASSHSQVGPPSFQI